MEDEGTAGTGGMGIWSNTAAGRASIPMAGSIGQPYKAYTTLRVPTPLNPHYSEKRGSADSLVEAVSPSIFLISSLHAMYEDNK